MKKCKHCKSEIDSKAKVCPHCRKRQGHPVLGGILIFIGIVIVLGGISSMDDSKNSNNANNNSGNGSTDEKFDYEVTSQYADEYGVSYYIEGTVTNKKDKEYSYVQIEFICYDSDGNNLGTAIDNTNNLLGNQTWKFKAMFLGTGSETVDHCDYHEITNW